MHAGLLKMMERHDFLSNPRGLGLMRAVDVLNPATRTLDHDLRDQIVDTAFHHGLLLLGCGEAAIRFCPPLCLSKEQVDVALGIIDTVLAECTAEAVAA